MKRFITLLLCILSITLVFAAARPSLDGRAVVANNGDLPSGLFAKTVGYLPGDSVSVTNPTTGNTVEVLVLGAIDPSEGIAILLSPEAANRLQIKKNSNIQVKITKRTGQLDIAVKGTAILGHDDGTVEELPPEKEEKYLAVASKKPIIEESTEEDEYTDTALELDDVKMEISQNSPLETQEVEQKSELEPVNTDSSDFGELGYIIDEKANIDEIKDNESVTDYSAQDETEITKEENIIQEQDFEPVENETITDVNEYDKQMVEKEPIEDYLESSTDDSIVEEYIEDEAIEEVSEAEPISNEFSEVDETNPDEPEVDLEKITTEDTTEQIEEPVEESIEEPEEESIEEPVEETTEEPIEESIEEPIEESIEEPVEETTEEPEEESIEEPVEETTEEPEEESIEEPVEESIEEPIEETTEEPIEDSIEEPVEESIDEPGEQTIEQPEESVIESEDSSEEMIEEPIEDEIVEMDESIEEHTDEETIDPKEETNEVIDENVVDQNKQVLEEEIETVIEEPEVETSDIENESYKPIILVPTQSVIPEPQPELSENDINDSNTNVIDEEPIISETITTKKQSTRNGKIVESTSELKKDKYYIQIATLTKQENIDKILSDYSKYPIILLKRNGASGYQILVGPLTVDEYGMILEKFKSFGFKDSFIKKIK